MSTEAESCDESNFSVSSPPRPSEARCQTVLRVKPGVRDLDYTRQSGRSNSGSVRPANLCPASVRIVVNKQEVIARVVLHHRDEFVDQQ